MATTSGRIIPALLAAAGLPAMILAAQSIVEDLPAYAHGTAPGVAESVAECGVLFLVAAVPTLLLGLPAFLLLNALGKVRWWTALPAGLLIGLGTFQALSYLSFGSWRVSDFQYGGLILFGLMGCASAATAWIIWRLPARAPGGGSPS